MGLYLFQPHEENVLQLVVKTKSIASPRQQHNPQATDSLM